MDIMSEFGFTMEIVQYSVEQYPASLNSNGQSHHFDDTTQDTVSALNGHNHLVSIIIIIILTKDLCFINFIWIEWIHKKRYTEKGFQRT